MSTCWPRPLACRSCSASRIPCDGVQARQVVGDRDADARRRAVGKAGHVHDAGLALDHRVVAGQRARAGRSGRSRRSSSRSAADSAPPPTRSRTRARPGCRAGSSRSARRPSRRAGAARRRRPAVFRSSATLFLLRFSARKKLPAAVDERPPAARVVAVLRLFDLQHVGAHVAEHHRAERPGDDPREIDHPQPLEWSHVRRL